MDVRQNRSDDQLPILSGKRFDEVSVLVPEALLREARRQKDMATGDVPEICMDEREAAALYASAAARRRPVLCGAHVTNQMGQIEGDFE